METQLYKEVDANKWPIIYRPEYNVSFWGLERLHPGDSKKWGNIFKYLKFHQVITDSDVVVPDEATSKDLLKVHTKKYLRYLKCSIYVSQVTEVPVLMLVPNFLIQRLYLKPMRYQTGGSILAGKLAMERGWAINLGGGFHHCSAKSGGGFCPYADITLLIKFVFENYADRVSSVMIIDLDAHQGNGYQRDFLKDKRIYIFDMYNYQIYPKDEKAKRAINLSVELRSWTQDEVYLELLKINLARAFSSCDPDLVIYNAGTDILEGDPLGALSISPEGVIKRDQLVFAKAAQQHKPIVMLTSGGYLKTSANIIGQSIINLLRFQLIEEPVPKL